MGEKGERIKQKKKKKNIDNSMVIARGAGEGGITGDGKRLGFG